MIVEFTFNQTEQIDYVSRVLNKSTFLNLRPYKVTVTRLQNRHDSSTVVYANLETESENAIVLIRAMNRGGHIFGVEGVSILPPNKIKFKLGISSVDIPGNMDDFTDVVLSVTVTNKKLFYDHYIKSEDWRLLRNRIFRERGFQCELCNSKKNLQLHHITYENCGNENDADVMILCQDCHKLAHS